jgi:hypothetical protein
MIKDNGMRTCNCTVHLTNPEICEGCTATNFVSAQIFVDPIWDTTKSEIIKERNSMCENLKDCGQAVRETGISSALSGLKSAEERLRKVWEEVVIKIKPVTTPGCYIEPNRVPFEKKSVSTSSPLSMEISSVGGKLEDLISYMENILNQIEL